MKIKFNKVKYVNFSITENYLEIENNEASFKVSSNGIGYVFFKKDQCEFSATLWCEEGGGTVATLTIEFVEDKDTLRQILFAIATLEIPVSNPIDDFADLLDGWGYKGMDDDIWEPADFNYWGVCNE